MAERFSLKDHLFNAETVAVLGGHFEEAGVFDAQPFVDAVMRDLLPLELKERMNLIADVLEQFLPPEFEAAAAAILKALPPPLDPDLTDDDFGHFIYAPLGIYVERHGIERHFSSALDLIEELTQRFSMEYSIRAFLRHDPGGALDRLRRWTDHPHYHVRRLVSEGTRPRLPWGQSVSLAPEDTLPLLDALHADPTRFVTRSVANHLNDLTRDHAGLVLDHLARWRAEGRQDPMELAWMERHALRNLIKAGDTATMTFLGFDGDVVAEAGITIEPGEVPIGEAARIAMRIVTRTDAPLLVDYVIDFVKANGGTAPKVFKVKTCEAQAGVPLELAKTHRFKKGATTFTHYPGAHRLRLQVNGTVVARTDFTLS